MPGKDLSHPTARRARRAAVDIAWQVAYRAGFAVARVWWHLRRPAHQGALVAVRVGDDLLLVRASYRREWNFPGGGVRSDETPSQAAHRELREEVGLSGLALDPAGAEHGLWDGRRDCVYFFETRLEQAPVLRVDGREIVGAQLVGPDMLKRVALTGPVAAYLARFHPKT